MSFLKITLYSLFFVAVFEPQLRAKAAKNTTPTFAPWGAAYSIVADGEYVRKFHRFQGSEKEKHPEIFHELASEPQPYFCSLKTGFVDTGRELKKYLVKNKDFKKKYFSYRSAGAKRILDELLKDGDQSKEFLKKLSDFALQERFTASSLKTLMLLAHSFLDAGQLFLSHIYAQAAYQVSVGLDLQTTKDSLVFLVHLYSLLDFNKMSLPSVDLDKALEQVGQKDGWFVVFAGEKVSIAEFISSNPRATAESSAERLLSPDVDQLADALRFSAPSPNAFFNPFDFHDMEGADRRQLVEACSDAPKKFKRMFYALFLREEKDRTTIPPTFFKETQWKYWELFDDPLFSPEYRLAVLPVLPIESQRFGEVYAQGRSFKSVEEIRPYLLKNHKNLYVQLFGTLFEQKPLKPSKVNCELAFSALRIETDFHFEKKKLYWSPLPQNLYLDFLIPCLVLQKEQNPPLGIAHLGIKDKALVALTLRMKRRVSTLQRELETIERFEQIDLALAFRYAASLDTFKLEDQKAAQTIQLQKAKYLKRMLNGMTVKNSDGEWHYLQMQFLFSLSESQHVFNFPQIDAETLGLMQRSLKSAGVLGVGTYGDRERFYAKQAINYFQNKLGDTSSYEDVLRDLYAVYWFSVDMSFASEFAESFSSDPKKAEAIFEKIRLEHQKLQRTKPGAYKKEFSYLEEIITLVRKNAKPSK